MAVRIPKKNVLSDPEHDPTKAFYPVDLDAKLDPDTICYHIRLIYLQAQENDDAYTMALANLCNHMAKRMNAKLVYYHRLIGEENGG